MGVSCTGSDQDKMCDQSLADREFCNEAEVHLCLCTVKDGVTQKS
jgi:hypothetical protein